MSKVRANALENLTGGPADLTKQWAAKAWASLNGQSNPASVRESRNVSSLTDYGQGQYGLNLASAMSSGEFGMAFATHITKAYTVNFSTVVCYPVNAQLANFITGYINTNGSSTVSDHAYISGVIHGDLA